MGTHYNSAANDITLTAVNSFIDDDKELRNDIITGNYFKEEGKAIICLLYPSDAPTLSFLSLNR